MSAFDPLRTFGSCPLVGGGTSRHYRRMDVTYGLWFYGGPIALVVLICLEANRRTHSFLPHITSAILMLLATVGISQWWLLFVSVGFSAPGMTANQFERESLLALLAALAIVVGAYLLVAAVRLKRSKR